MDRTSYPELTQLLNDDSAESSRAFDEAYDRRFVEILKELCAEDLADLFSTNQAGFDQLRERGRRAFMAKAEDAPDAIADVVVRYEREARQAASAPSYTAAITMLGAAMEGLLLLRCLRSRKKATTVAAALKLKGGIPKDIERWTLDLLIQVCLKAGWLPAVDLKKMRILPDGLAHRLRRMRNYIHPGRVARERPWVEADEGEYRDAEVAYTAIFATVKKGSHLKKLERAAERSSI